MEEIIIGTLLASGEGLEHVDLEPEEFSYPYSILFQRILELHDRSQPYDISGICDYLEEKGELGTFGGRNRLLQLALNATTPALLPHYVSRMREKAARHRMASALAEAHELLLRGGAFEDVEAKVEEALAWRSHSNLEVVGVADVLRSWEEKRKEKKALSTPFSGLQEFVRGFSPGEYLIVGGRPGVGKTALLTTLAVQWCVHARCPGVVISLETPAEHMLARMMSALTGIPLWSLRDGFVPAEAKARYEQAKALLEKAPLEFVVRTEITPAMVRKVLATRRTKPLVLFLDYIQLMATGNSSRYEEVTRISRALKTLAMQREVFLVAAAQLSRYAERTGKEPELADLRDSSALEADADYVWILFRPEDVSDNLVCLKVAKNRNGPVGAHFLHFSGAISLFTDAPKTCELEVRM